MSTVAIALSLVVIVAGVVLVLLWASIDPGAELESRPLTDQARREREQDYLGVHVHPERMPRAANIRWRGGDDALGGWTWQEDPAERAQHLGDYERRRRFHRQ